MKSLMLAGAAMLTLTAGLSGVAIAQMPPPPTQAPGAQPLPPGSAMPPVGDSAPMPASPAPPPAGADPNAGQPTGAVPADPGMVPAPAGAPSDPSAPVGSSRNPVEVGGNMTPPPTEAKDYPLCSKTVQDSCMNPGEAKKAKAKKRR
jgi:hypothetical protein